MPSVETFDITDRLPEGDRWSTWDQPAAGERGPQPYPPWLVTELAAVDTELGILKTGKEADVFLLRRGVPQTGPSCLLAAKRYRDAGHRMFHRDSGYLEGRRVRESRASRAMAGRTRVRAAGDRRAVGHRRVRGAGPAVDRSSRFARAAKASAPIEANSPCARRRCSRASTRRFSRRSHSP